MSGPPNAEVSGLVLVVVVIMVVIVVMIVIASAAAPYLFELLVALVGLLTVFAVTLDSIAQFFFGLMNLPFAFVVAIGACRQR
jgi:hypothetical protein